MNKKAFTLIELLAVISILAIIALIITPMALETIADARKQTFLDNAKTLKKAADSYYMETNMSNKTSLPLLVTYNNKKVSYCNDKPGLEYKGSNPQSGNIYINTNGDVEMKIYDSATNACAVKTASDKEPHLDKVKKENCKLINKSC